MWIIILICQKELLYTLFFFLNRQLGSGPSPQSCLYFQDFQGSKVLKICFEVWPNTNILSLFKWFSAYVIYMLFTVSQKSKQFLWNWSPSYLHNRLMYLIWLIDNRWTFWGHFWNTWNFISFAYWRWFSPKLCLASYASRASCL